MRAINQRLKEYFESKKIEAPEFYKKIGVERGEWSGWMNSNKAISVLRIQDILINCPDLSSRWLLIGEGNMIESLAETKTYVLPAEREIELMRKLLEKSDELYRELEKDRNRLLEESKNQIAKPKT